MKNGIRIFPLVVFLGLISLPLVSTAFAQFSENLVASSRPTGAGTAYGLCVSSYQVDYKDRHYLQMLRVSGASVVRIDLKYDNQDKDFELAQILHNAGYTVIGVLGKSSTLWNSGGFQPVQDVTYWKNVCNHVLSQYQGIIDYVEVWNEPDLPTFSSGYMDGTPTHYMEILKATFDVGKTLGFTKDKLLGPSLATMRDSQTTPGDHYGGYFAKQIKGLGVENYIKAITVHIYDWFLDGEAGLRNAADVYNAAKKIFSIPVWTTETGHQGSETSVKMNQWFTELKTVGCPVVIWYTYIDGDNNYGLLNADFSPKDSYAVFQSFAKAAGGFRI